MKKILIRLLLGPALLSLVLCVSSPVVVATINDSTSKEAASKEPASKDRASQYRYPKGRAAKPAATNIALLNYADREEVKAFAAALAAEATFSEAELLDYFRQARYQQSIIDAITRPAEKTLIWEKYRAIFLTERRRRQGSAFIRRYRKPLEAAYEKYGVPAVIIAAVLGVETSYGRNRGNYRVLDALVTLGFDYPPRQEFFREELRELILLAGEEGRKITRLKGSYAGAMGWGQFIPSSYRHYAVDFDGDGQRDIWNNPVDAIGSVANYLNQHGWQRDGFIALEMETADVDALRATDIFNQGLAPSISHAALSQLGVSQLPSLAGDELLSPMRLQLETGQEYWLGGMNFYVITRYNHSKLYAMAVFQLSEVLR